MKKIALILLVLSFTNVNAENKLSTIKSNITQEFDKIMTGDKELYVPLYAWHNRAYYDNADKLNETTSGIGFGKSYLDENKNWHGLYAMAFEDSNRNFEPIIGYGYTKNWYKNYFNVGLGYTVLVTARKELDYIPIPGVLPIASVGYKDIKLSGTYAPGGEGNGNVAFFWGTYKF